jgi:hypothetical protein
LPVCGERTTIASSAVHREWTDRIGKLRHRRSGMGWSGIRIVRFRTRSILAPMVANRHTRRYPLGELPLRFRNSHPSLDFSANQGARSMYVAWFNSAARIVSQSSKSVARQRKVEAAPSLTSLGAACLLHKMVRPERFELPTFWFVARRSIQLS